MTLDEYEVVTDALADLAADIERQKRPGYVKGSENVLANFHGVAERTGMSPEQVWAVYYQKHLDAVFSFMLHPELPVSEAAPGRFADIINYTRLGWALYCERERAGKERNSGDARTTA